MKTLATLGSAVLFATPATAQVCEPQWSPDLASYFVSQGAILTATTIDDGAGPRLYVGGRFLFSGPTTLNAVARWSGEQWEALGGGLPVSGEGVTSLAGFNDPGGPSIYAAGAFTIPPQTTRSSLARWNGSTWAPIADYGSRVHVLTTFDDGSGPALYAAGVFGSLGGAPAMGIARWNGTAWSGVGSGLVSGGGPASVEAFTPYADGTTTWLVAGGTIDASGTTPLANITRWNGAAWSSLGAGLPGVAVQALAAGVEKSGPVLYAGGSVTGAGGKDAARVFRWNGADWTPLGPVLTLDAAVVHALAVIDLGAGPRLFAGFADTPVYSASPPPGGIAEWTGTDWQIPGGGINGIVNALVEEPSGAGLMAAGDFTVAGGIVSGRVSRWNGGTWAPLRASGGVLGNHAASLKLLDTGNGPRLHLAGSFQGIGLSPVKGVARLDEQAWTGFGDSPSWFSDLAVFDDGTGEALYACGGEPRAARYSGGVWTNISTGLTNPAYLLGVFEGAPTPTLCVGGNYGGGVLRWAGSQWTPLGGGVSGLGGTPSVSAFATFDEGAGPRFFVGGSFTHAAGIATGPIARWNGTTWSAVPGLSPAVVVTSLVVGDGLGAPRLFVAAGYVTPTGAASSRVAAWDGLAWTIFGDDDITGTVRSTAVFDDGNGPALYATGKMESSAGTPLSHLAKWTGTQWVSPGAGLSANGLTMLTVDHGDRQDLWIGGTFTAANGLNSARLARLEGCSICYPDCNRDGALTVADFGCFQTRFVTGDTYSDCDKDGQLTPADFGCFQTAFVAGCP